MRKIAVVFPGIGYTKDRPLLYYSAKYALSCGYDLIHIEFRGIDWSKEKLKDKEFLLQTLDKCLDITEEALSPLGNMTGDEVVFISKSIGTVAATAYADKKGIKARHICFSPLVFISNFIEEEGGILFYGDADPLADHKEIEKIALEKKLVSHRIEEGNHSLETGDVFTDMDNLRQMIRLAADVIKPALNNTLLS